jgi:FAD:protein FMN transferase
MSERELDQPRHPSRREFLTLGIGAFVVASVPWAALRRPALVRRSIPVMGTIAEVAVVHRDAAYAQQAIDAAFAALRGVERTMTRFDPASDVGRANLGAAAAPVPVTRATAEVLAEALRWAELSEGAFDPALARVVALWDVGRRTRPLPEEDVRTIAGRRLYQHLEIGRRGDRAVVVYHDPEVAIDLGGIAKGYAVDRAVATLRDWGIRHALVNAGGDLYALGHSPAGDPWEVGIRSPDNPARLATTLRMEDRGVATSGDYSQFFEHGGRRYHHLIDPRTGEPHRWDRRSITVAAPTCMAADAAATAVFGSAPAIAARMLAPSGDVEVVHLG